MADSVDIMLWIDRRWKAAIEKHLKDKTLQEHLENVLDDLCDQLPRQEYDRISREIWQEDLAARQAEEAARTYAAYHVTENGREWYFKTTPGEELLTAAQKLRIYTMCRNGTAPNLFIKMFADGRPITAEEYDELIALRMENTGKVTGVFDISFDKQEFSAVNIMDGWQSWSMGIKTRDGKNWHEATVGHILHNIMYTGVLRSGCTQSEVFPDLQIISPENFGLVQKLMAERANECNALRTMPRNTRGQSLLSGNVFCGHCGGRLTLTTNGTTRVNAAGEKVGRKRIRYVCYNKTRKRSNCDGQTGYTMHILDKMVTDILHQVFDRMRSVEENEIISRTHRSAMVSLKKRLSDAKAESAKATKEYESLKLEVIKAVQGESAFPMDVLSELVNNARTRMLDANAQLTELNEEVEKSNQRIEAIKADYRRIMEWSEMFDGSDMNVKKMIAGYIIKRVDVYSDYRLHIEFNMSFAQFELGLDSLETNPA